MALAAKQRHIAHMKKSPRVTFKMLRIAENDWQIAAECPGTETHYIKRLNSNADVDEWLTGTPPHSLASLARLRKMTSAGLATG
jgi:hypothetical protein